MKVAISQVLIVYICQFPFKCLCLTELRLAAAYHRYRYGLIWILDLIVSANKRICFLS